MVEYINRQPWDEVGITQLTLRYPKAIKISSNAYSPVSPNGTFQNLDITNINIACVFSSTVSKTNINLQHSHFLIMLLCGLTWQADISMLSFLMSFFLGGVMKIYSTLCTMYNKSKYFRFWLKWELMGKNDIGKVL